MLARTNRRPVVVLVVIALAVAAVLVSGCSRLLSPDALDGVLDPIIVPASGVSGTRAVTREFGFEDATVRMDVPVEKAVYQGAITAEKSAVFLSGEQPADWVSGYYRAFISEKHQEQFYSSIVSALHQVRDQRDLDEARYLELVVAMVQTMEYRIDPVNLAPKFPIETFADGFGDCDDKTLLAAGILARDGYDVAVLVFGPEKHVALGVKAPDLEFQGTGYAYVETTGESFVGVVPDKLSDGSTIESQPEVIRVGEGTRAYDDGGQITFIRKRLREIEEERAGLEKQIKRYNSRLDSDQATLEAQKRQIEAEGASASIAEVDAFNARVASYNALVATTGKAIERHNALVEVQKYVAAHRTARPQAYAKLKAAP